MSVRFVVKGLNFNRLIKNAIERNIRVWNVHRDNKILNVTTNEACRKKFIALIEDSGYLYEIHSEGISTHQLIARCGLIIGTIITVIVMIFLNNFIFIADIDGTTNTSVVFDTLDQLNIKGITPKYTIDLTAIEDALMHNMNISFADVKVRGVHLVIKVKEELPKPVIYEDIITTKLVSKYDAVITRIVTIEGKVAVQVGQAVAKGTTLIEADINEDNPIIKGHGVIGEVFGKVYYVSRIVVPKKAIISLRSGEFVDFSYVEFMGNSAHFEPEYPQYEVEYYKTRLFGILPLYKVVARYFELASFEIENMDYENPNGLILAELNSIKLKVPENAEYIDSYNIVREIEGAKVIDVYYEVEQIIASNLSYM